MKVKKTIGVIGGIKHAWVSVERTRHFFMQVLEQRYNIVYLDDNSEQTFYDLDLVLNFFGKAGWKRPKGIKCPLLLCVHGAMVIDQQFLLTHLPNLTNKDGLIVNCQSDIAILNGMCNTIKPKLCLLPLPVDIKMFYKTNKKIAKSIFNIHKDELCLGLVCRLLPQKNIHIFIRLVHEVKRQTSKKIKAFLIGNFWVDYPVLDFVSTEYNEYIEKLIESLGLTNEIIYLPAELSNDELRYAYNAMDFLIHPTNSLDENFGYVPIEAMACGTPVIGSAYGGLKDSITEETGLKFPTWITENGIRMDKHSAIDEILTLNSNPELYKIKSKNCLARVAGLYTFKQFATNLTSHIESLMANYKIGESEMVDIQIPKKTESKDALPLTKSGSKWIHYKDVISKYVSQACPQYDSNSEAYLDVPLIPLKDKTYKRDDPAWPAVYPINEMEIKIINHCVNTSLTYTDCIKNEFNPETVQSLINKGVLVMKEKQQ